MKRLLATGAAAAAAFALVGSSVPAAHAASPALPGQADGFASVNADSDPGRLVQRANAFVDSGECEAGGTVTEPSTYYAYQLDAASSVPSAVSAGAGRLS